MMDADGQTEVNFKAADRLKACQAMAETSRKLANVMDAKAGFLSALNLGCMAFAWSSARLLDGGGGVVRPRTDGTTFLRKHQFFSSRR